MGPRVTEVVLLLSETAHKMQKLTGKEHREVGIKYGMNAAIDV